MHLTVILTLLTLAAGQPGAQARFQHRHAFSSAEWQQHGKTAGDATVDVLLALSLGRPEEAVQALMRVSDHESPGYGRFWTPEAVGRAFGPTPAADADISAWVRSHGIDPAVAVRRSRAGHLRLRLNVDEASRMLQTEFFVFRNAATGERGVACHNYSLPSAVAGHIDFVTATGGAPPDGPTNRGRRRRAPRDGRPGKRQAQVEDAAAKVDDCSQFTTPSCLRGFYGIPKRAGGEEAHPDNSFGVFQPSWQTWLPEDLDQFFRLLQPELVGKRPAMEPIDGGYTQQDFKIPSFNTEPDLDFEYAMAMAAPQTITDVQVGDETRLGNLNLMLAAFDKYYCDALDPTIDPMGGNVTTDCGTVTPPKVLSISYTWGESDFSPEYLRHQCAEFLKLGLMGVTVVVSASDFGASSGNCAASEKDGDGTHDGRFTPSFPSSCPWVTTVGGTQRTTQPPTDKSQAPAGETTFRCSPWANHSVTLSSGGGFSDEFPVPWYQTDAVQRYRALEQGHLASLGDRVSASGRGYPDVAMQAYGYVTIINGRAKLIHGTSASAPVFASVVSLINDERLKLGKRTVGFINPALYANPSMLNDITTGSNLGCGVDPAFQAAEGWDAATGLGSANYIRMRDYFISLP
ncbi:hypothetical protein CcaCcLH18_13096 [Colletotrichum camelliae]|nr:hypothetical protein CcaCcLH18_13096 [Colletotrichum camelliae]